MLAGASRGSALSSRGSSGAVGAGHSGNLRTTGAGGSARGAPHPTRALQSTIKPGHSPGACRIIHHLVIIVPKSTTPGGGFGLGQNGLARLRVALGAALPLQAGKGVALLGLGGVQVFPGNHAPAAGIVFSHAQGRSCAGMRQFHTAKLQLRSGKPPQGNKQTSPQHQGYF